MPNNSSAMSGMRAIILHPLTMLVIGSVVGFASSDYLAFRTNIRDQQKAAIENSRSVEQDLIQVLMRFASIAEGKSSNNADSISSLRNVLLKDQSAAERVTQLIPSARPEFESMGKNAIILLQQAEALTGPLQGRSMTEAVSEYLNSRQNLQIAATNSTSAYLIGR